MNWMCKEAHTAHSIWQMTRPKNMLAYWTHTHCHHLNMSSRAWLLGLIFSARWDWDIQFPLLLVFSVPTPTSSHQSFGVGPMGWKAFHWLFSPVAPCICCATHKNLLQGSPAIAQFTPCWNSKGPRATLTGPGKKLCSSTPTEKPRKSQQCV